VIRYLLELYRKGDVLVLLRLEECFGLATVDAIVGGVFVNWSDAGGTAEIEANILRIRSPHWRLPPYEALKRSTEVL
jgi:hypothetical protein